MHDTLSGRAEELGRLTDLIRTSLSLADSSIPAINAQLDELAAMGLDNLELEGPVVYSRAASCSPTFDDARVVFAATLVMPGGLGCTIWGAEEYAERYGESGHEPPDLRERFAPYDRLPAIVRATLPAHAPKLLSMLTNSFLPPWRQPWAKRSPWCGAAVFTSSRRPPTAIRGPLTHARGTDTSRMTTFLICRPTASIRTSPTIHVCTGGPAE